MPDVMPDENDRTDAAPEPNEDLGLPTPPNPCRLPPPHLPPPREGDAPPVETRTDGWP